MDAQSLAQVSNYLVDSALVVYTLALVAYAAEVAFGRRAPGRAAAAHAPAAARSGGTATLAPPAPPAAPARLDRSERMNRIAVSLTTLAFVLHAAGVVTRAVSAGRVPWGNMYEFSITGALAVTAAYLLLLRRYDVRYLGVVVVPLVLLTLGLAVTVLYTDSAELVPALDSVWLVIHVSAVVVAAGVFTAGAGLTVLHLLRARAERRAALGGWLGRLPSAERLDRLAYRMHAFAFPLYTFAVVAGAIWAENAWGRYWGWDPKETWAFITWVVYAAYLHARATAGWGGRRAAVIALVGCAALWFNYYGVNLWFSGLHSYAGV
ncbi:c-type cytochrome biogenesis protein CcsB [Vallicoccus soli]|uniref:Heme exporter protein C n=1 Tax=Vallicoccus soli TaxID=2339232 RepID=A0A3A3Z102_9ACTN|nr:c-type cytochrome biogenesis protein CcsB [Vallicoccus soli]RJK96096.1 c-type cytochrome biogenesis protein CcsB [Vallicoccus soli]